uniref:Uncharacterized protein n=1 Tax=Anguilla anguilla TaxID=7936 RepID=A0A0E9S1A9_ANGAN
MGGRKGREKWGSKDRISDRLGNRDFS